MKFVILCGGSGERMNGYSMPKPLNMIWTKPAIYYTLCKLPENVNSLNFIMSRHLDNYNFESIVKNIFRKKTCNFYRLPYFTRGPVETALLGIKELIKENKDIDLDEPIVFVDNDVFYEFPNNFFSNCYTNHFLGYCKDTTGSEAYSFLKFDNNSNNVDEAPKGDASSNPLKKGSHPKGGSIFDNNIITDIQEKCRISSDFCCGIYGFKSISSFLNISNKFLQTHHEQEYYMSCLFQMLISENQIINGIRFPNACHLGSLTEVKNNINNIPIPKLRICFDLDNTLVSYPYIVGDYKSVKPITDMIMLAKNLQKMGHTIIIYTARRMETHKHNIGAVVKDIARDTIDILDKYEIPYDELIFGKPIADVYIDDKSVNPYRNDFANMGLIFQEPTEEPINKLPNNKYNKVILKNKDVIKSGPVDILIGELEFYKNIPCDSNCINMFPKLLDFNVDSKTVTMRLEYIKGIPLYYLYRAELLTKDIISNLFLYLDVLHNTTNNKELPDISQVNYNYVNKLENRFLNESDYPFDKEDVQLVQQKCLYKIKKYCDSELISKNICQVIHGDFWFSNIILEFKKNIKAIDMKGHLNGYITTGGDSYYDYAKLFQSFLGYDIALYGDTINFEYRDSLIFLFNEECKKRDINVDILKDITFGLVMGTFYFIDSITTKERVWKWIKETFM